MCRHSRCSRKGTVPVGARGRGLWRKGRPRFPGREAKGDILFWKENVPPGPPKEKRGGISISPRTPLKRHKGAGLRSLPFGNPSRSWTGERQRKEKQGASYLQPGVCRARRCGGRSSLNGTGIAQPVGAFQVWSEVRDGQPPVLGDLTPSCQIIPQRFFFCTVSGTFSF